MFFWTIWKKFYPTRPTFLGWLNYKLCQKMPKLEKNPCWWAPVVIVGSSSIFLPRTLKIWKNLKSWVFSISVTYFGCLQMVLGFGQFSFVQKNTFFKQNRKKGKIWWFFGYSENQLYPVTFVDDFFFLLAKLNVL